METTGSLARDLRPGARRRAGKPNARGRSGELVLELCGLAFGPEHGAALAARGILYAPDYVINAGGIISVTLEHLARQGGAHCAIEEVTCRLCQIPDRLRTIWEESDATGVSPDRVADRLAQILIGRA